MAKETFHRDPFVWLHSGVYWSFLVIVIWCKCNLVSLLPTPLVTLPLAQSRSVTSNCHGDICTRYTYSYACFMCFKK